MGGLPSQGVKLDYRTASLNGVRYNYIQSEPLSGNITGTVFLIHGWPDLSLGWRNQIPFLVSRGFRVIAPDMMGYGGTEAPEEIEFYTLKRASDDIAALAHHLGLSRIILGGHDWGGAVYTILAPFKDLRTDDVQDYLSLDHGHTQNTTRVRQVLNTVYGATLPNSTWAFNASGVGFDFDLLDGVIQDSSLLSKEELDFYVENYSEDPFNKTLNWYRAGELDWEHELLFVPNNTSYNAKFSQPALYIGAPEDPALPLSLSIGMETYFNNLTRGEVGTLPNASHWMMWDRPDHVNEHIGNWLTNSVLLNMNLTAGLGGGCLLGSS
ncbi:hypothetical protein KHU50_005795 [Colletotrichum sp. SAR 10_65]|nr:hypothetical protein KHU50_005795 [Colletotrichum sp. SAR 10_65]KAI8178501.1 hypothetical protein K4K51_004503 [Colletotrichum sp. SAR 10_75]KAI8205960.1 hypothetical protein K4K52_003571 [Colletotrichum sp. SAR 10_76]KAI8229165.1 hypothetical protein K4K53_005627 [Colletotrichum sp. SAR 10_77]